MNVWTALFKNRLTAASILAPALIICVFLLIFLPGVRHASDHTNHFKIAVVNEAGDVGVTIQSQVTQHVPFRVETNLKRDDAQAALNRGDVQMVMTIPADFASNVRTGKAKLDFTINGAVPSGTKSAMQSAEGKIADAVNTAAIEMAKQGILQGVTGQLQQSHLPVPVQSQMTQVINGAVSAVPSQPVRAAETIVNNSNNPVPSLLPFLTIITYFIGGMMTSAISWLAIRTIRTPQHNSYAAGVAQVGVNIVAAAVVSALDLLLFHTFGANAVASAWTAWWSMALGYFTMCTLIQMFLYLVGLPGMVVGLLLFPVQLITAGVALPPQLLPDAYTTLSSWLPASHIGGVVFSTFLGGGVFSQDTSALATISVVCLAVIFLRLTIPVKVRPRAMMSVE